MSDFQLFGQVLRDVPLFAPAGVSAPHAAQTLGTWITLIAGFGLMRAGEFRRHRFNRNRLMLAGAIEDNRTLSLVYWWSIVPVLALAMAEFWWFGKRPGLVLLAASFVLVTGAVGLRLLALKALGPWWTLGCVLLPGAPFVNKGPYRFFRHPEYLSRTLEGAGLCLIIGSLWAGLFWVLWSSALAGLLGSTEASQRQRFSIPVGNEG